tara:strand:+ start:3157 stop:3645 length:489 start_codon:yes stop_codon:yes gene_type:complete
MKISGLNIKNMGKNIGANFGNLNQSLASSTLFTGIIIILMNIGSKYVMMELSPTQEALVRNMITRQLLIFCAVWLGTKNLVLSLGLTAVFHVLTTYLFNEDSRLCVIPHHFQVIAKTIDANKDGKISDKELNNAISILEKAKHEKQKGIYANVLENFQYSKI